MTVDVATPQDTRMTRARRAFRGWRKSRPFWGGLLLIAAGIEIFYSGNLNLGNIQIHLGLNGFKSYIIPLVVVLCGALIWATPMQRVFYGIIGTAAAVYSVVSVNLGGFIVGLLLGIFGGALSIAWVPDKRPVDQGVDHGEPDDEDATAELGAELPAYVAEDHDHWREPDTESSEELEGEQREPFRQPQAALDDEPKPVIPAARTASDADPATPAASDRDGEGGDEVDPTVSSDTTAPMSRVRGIPDVPHVRGLADVADSSPPVAADRAGDRGEERTDGRGDGGGHAGRDGHGSPRALTITVIALTIGAMAAFAVRNAAPAAADTCTPTPMQSAIQQAIAKAGGHGPAGTKTRPTAPKTTKTASTGMSKTSTGSLKAPAGTHAATATSASKGSSASASESTGQAAAAPTAGSQPHPIASLLGGALGILGLGSPTADATSATPDPNPSAEPSPSSSQPPTATPTTTPTTTPKPTPTLTAKPRPTVTRSATSRATASHGRVPTPSTSPTPPPCTNTPKALARAAGQPLVGERPATQKAALLSMTGLSYDGNVSLPTGNGSLEAMQFSMTSTTSTPFELDVPVGRHQYTIKSSKLTLTGTVKIFAAEIKGNLLGTAPVDFTPASPPPLPPLLVTDLFFTDATLTLVFVQTDTLTGDKLTITSD